MTVPIFDLSSLLTRADCDGVLGPARLLRAGIFKKDVGLNYDDLTDEARAASAENSLIAVNSNLTATRNQLAGLAVGASDLRRQLALREAQLVARKLFLEGQEANSTTPLGALANARVDADLELVDGFIAQVEAKKDTLSA
jgi:hypothetical protein